MVGENQQSPHVILRPYRDADAARAGGEVSPWCLSLDGVWRFRYAMTPDRLPDRFFVEPFDTADWDTVRVPHVWQQDGYDAPIYRNAPSDVSPYDPPLVPRDLNPSGAYVRKFTVPESWQGRRTFLRFEGVTSSYFVWVNGTYVGYDGGGYTPAEFDLTDVVRPGDNTLAVQVHRWSSGSYLENMDMWHLSGVFRQVWLYSTPQVWLRDVAVTTELGGDGPATRYGTAEFSIVAHIANASGAAGQHSVRAVLFAADGNAVCEVTADAAPTGSDPAVVELSESVTQAELWNDEQPYLYRLVLELIDASGTVIHVVGQDVGFRCVEVIDAQLCVNGVPVVLRGVNRHEHDPQLGRALPYERMVQDVKLLKQHNVNAVRASHYPNDPRWYELCNKYGIYVCDEVDVETHARMGPENSLADEPRWRAAMLDRFQAMVERDKNHPSVIMWSTGNEAGLGAAHFAMADYAREREPTRLLYHQANRGFFNGDAPYADVWGPRYPSPDRLARIAEETDRPVVMGEWAHMLGNGLGNYEDMWRIIRANRSLQGGFQWEWLSHELDRPLITTPDSSGNDIVAFLSGCPRIVDGRDGGSALYLTGMDDWVEIAADPRLDITGRGLTVDAWIKPAAWTGDFTVASKGRQYVLRLRDPHTVELAIDVGVVRVVAAAFPGDRHDTWFRLTGTYDGRRLRLYIDGELSGEVPATGAIVASPQPVTLGRNAAVHGHGHRGRTAHGTIDSVRIFDSALSGEQITDDSGPKAVLALDLNEFEDRGSYPSYGAGMFLVDGVIAADRTPLPAAEQLKYSHAPIRFSAVDAARGIVEVANDFCFLDTSGIELHWVLTDGWQTLAEGMCRPLIDPGMTRRIDLGMPPLARSDRPDRWLNLQAKLADATDWSDAGHVVAVEQFDARASADGSRSSGMHSGAAESAGNEIEMERSAAQVRVRAARFDYRFDTETGQLASMRANGRELLEYGPRLLVWRAMLSNEIAVFGSADKPPATQFRSAGLHAMTSTVTGFEVHDTGELVRIEVDMFDATTVPGQGFEHTMVYEVAGDGRISLHHNVTGVGDLIRQLPWLPRLGITLAMPARFDQFAWYGRGPGESYPDRKDAAFIGVWRGSVDDQYVSYLPPQDNGAKTDTQWARLTDSDGAGLEVAGDRLTVSVSRHNDTDLDRATYPFLLSPTGAVHLHIAHRVTGVGDTPNLVQPEYRIRPDTTHTYRIWLRPITDGRIAHAR